VPWKKSATTISQGTLRLHPSDISINDSPCIRDNLSRSKCNRSFLRRLIVFFFFGITVYRREPFGLGALFRCESATEAISNQLAHVTLAKTKHKKRSWHPSNPPKILWHRDISHSCRTGGFRHTKKGEKQQQQQEEKAEAAPPPGRRGVDNTDFGEIDAEHLERRNGSTSTSSVFRVCGGRRRRHRRRRRTHPFRRRRNVG
jgi:hypothetical protein